MKAKMIKVFIGGKNSLPYANPLLTSIQELSCYLGISILYLPQGQSGKQVCLDDGYRRLMPNKWTCLSYDSYSPRPPAKLSGLQTSDIAAETDIFPIRRKALGYLGCGRQPAP